MQLPTDITTVFLAVVFTLIAVNGLTLKDVRDTSQARNTGKTSNTVYLS